MVGARSRWFPTRQFFNPEYLHYEVVAEIDGQETTYSDNPAIGLPANNSSLPLQVLFQGATVDPTSRLANPETIGPWRFFVGSRSGRSGPDAETTESLNVIDTNGDEKGVGNGFRFLLLFDRGVNANTVVKSVTVWFRA